MPNREPRKGIDLLLLITTVGLISWGSLRLFEWKSRGGNWGNYWGINEEGWATLWGTFASAGLAATVAIYVLRRQSIAQAHAAEKDRHHQAELARQDRDITATIELRERVEALLEYQDGCWKNGMAPNPQKMKEMQGLLETAVYRWAVNSGLPTFDSAVTANMIASSTPSLIERIGYKTDEYSGNWIFFHRDAYENLKGLMDVMLFNLPKTAEIKWPDMSEKIGEYYTFLTPLAEVFRKEFRNATPREDEQGMPLDYRIEISKDEAIRRNIKIPFNG